MHARRSDALVRRAKRGDRAAFARLFQPRRPSIARHVRRILSPKAAQHEVEDVLQQTALRACASIGGLRADDARGFHAWLVAVAHNCAVSVARARARRGEDQRSEDRVSESPEAPADAAPAAPLARSALGHEELLRTIRCLALLRDDERLSIVLRGLQAAPWETLVMLVGHRSEGSTRKLHSRARGRLRERLARPA